MKKVGKTFLAFWCAFLLALTPMSYARMEADAEGAADATEAVQADVIAESEDQADERRKKILQEAVDALANTKVALQALEEERIDDALEALAMTTGKLELILARDPTLALAVTDVSLSSSDILATPEAVRSAISKAEDALDDGRIQDARHILGGLASEMVITVTSLPLATYPDAIKKITPLIDEGNLEEAEQGLRTALNTLVLTDHVIPLPVLRSEALLENAAELAQKTARTDEENEELANQLLAVRDQLEMAQLLGYGNKDEYKPLYTQLDEIHDRARDGEIGADFFDKFKTSMSSLMD